jgi:predicted anti-sigma-YlaC factor YlaD
MMHALFYPCREAARLVSLGREGPLRLDQRARLAVHLRMCTACRAFAGQLEVIEAALRLRAAAGEAGLPVSPELDAAARERIRERLRRG